MDNYQRSIYKVNIRCSFHSGQKPHILKQSYPLYQAGEYYRSLSLCFPLKREV